MFLQEFDKTRGYLYFVCVCPRVRTYILTQVLNKDSVCIEQHLQGNIIRCRNVLDSSFSRTLCVCVCVCLCVCVMIKIECAHRKAGCMHAFPART